MTATIDDLTERRMARRREPTPLDVFMEKSKAIRKITDTIALHHAQAYTTAAEAHLKDDEGRIDYGRLEDADIQKKFAENMRDFYVGKAREYFKIGAETKLNEEQIEMLLSSYAGITYSELLRIIQQTGEGFTLEAFRSVSDKFKKSIQDKLEPHAASHITQEHVPGIVKQMGLEDRLDASKMRVEDIVGLMAAYHTNAGVISPRDYNRAIYRRPEPKAA